MREVLEVSPEPLLLRPAKFMIEARATAFRIDREAT